MKKVLPVLAVVAVAAAVIAILAFRSGASREEAVTAGLSGDKVEVLYFHLTRRCVTCQAVENVSGEAVKELYPAEVGKGTVVLRTLNIEDKSSEADAARVKATGQCLLVISGDTRIDLTSEGFMNARNSPEKLKEVIKKTVDPLLTALKSN
jgi:hypothetical protein